MNFKRQTFTELFDFLFDSIDIINSNFTTHSIIVLVSILSFNVFAAYNIVREFTAGSGMFFFFLINDSFWILIQYVVMSLMAFMGNSTSREAEKSILIVLHATGLLETDHHLQRDLKIFLDKLKGRNKCFENEFFTINWKMIMSVGFQ
jgi:hypothetical protein